MLFLILMGMGQTHPPKKSQISTPIPTIFGANFSDLMPSDPCNSFPNFTTDPAKKDKFLSSAILHERFGSDRYSSKFQAKHSPYPPVDGTNSSNFGVRVCMIAPVTTRSTRGRRIPSSTSEESGNSSEEGQELGLLTAPRLRNQASKISSGVDSRAHLSPHLRN